ncbi:MAG TPA: hypothetical protein VD927_17120 [Chryseosolibacter sp.]|nr:hypothetical protein [Chryseosolibacter sp.]
MQRITDKTKFKFIAIASASALCLSLVLAIVLWRNNASLGASLDTEKIKYEALLSEKLLLEKRLEKNKKRLEFFASDWIEHQRDPNAYEGFVDRDHYTEEEKRFIRYYDSLVRQERNKMLGLEEHAFRTTTMKIFTDSMHNLIQKSSLTATEPGI